MTTWILALGIWCVGGGLLVWIVVAFRARREVVPHVCAACGYPVRGLERCPECGLVVSDASVHRLRPLTWGQRAARAAAVAGLMILLLPMWLGTSSICAPGWARWTRVYAAAPASNAYRTLRVTGSTERLVFGEQVPWGSWEGPSAFRIELTEHDGTVHSVRVDAEDEAAEVIARWLRSLSLLGEGEINRHSDLLADLVKSRLEVLPETLAFTAPVFGQGSLGAGGRMVWSPMSTGKITAIGFYFGITWLAMGGRRRKRNPIRHDRQARCH